MRNAVSLCRSLLLQLILAGFALGIAGTVPAAAQKPGYSPGSPAAEQYTEQIPAGRGVGSGDGRSGGSGAGRSGEAPGPPFGTGIEPAATGDPAAGGRPAPAGGAAGRGPAAGAERERRSPAGAVGQAADRIPADVAASAGQQTDDSASRVWLLTLLFAAACAVAAVFVARARVRRATG